MTSHLIAALDLPTYLIRQIGSELANPALKQVNKTDRQLSKDEEGIVKSFTMHHCVHEFMFHSNTRFNESYEHFHLPPVGYSFTCHSRIPFDPHIYTNLFYGFAKVTINNLEHFDFEKWKAVINALIKDESPNPPLYNKKMDPKGPWYPSLGKNGWVSLCRTLDTEYGDQTYVLYVVAGLDPATYEELERAMLNFYENATLNKEKDASIAGAMLRTFEWYRKVAEENRRRILYLLVTHLDGIHCNAVVEPSLINATTTTMDYFTQQWLADNGVTNLHLIPSTYQRPTEVPHHCVEFEKTRQRLDAESGVLDVPSLSESDEGAGNNNNNEEPSQSIPTESRRQIIVDYQPKSLRPELEIMLDDVVPYPHDPDHCLRLSNHCLMKDQVVRIFSPFEPVRIMTIKADFNTGLWLSSFPAMSTEIPASEADRYLEDVISTIDSPYLNIRPNRPYVMKKGSVIWERDPFIPPVFHVLHRSLAMDAIDSANSKTVPLFPELIRISRLFTFNNRDLPTE